MEQWLQQLLWYPGSSLSQAAEGQLMTDRRRREAAMASDFNIYSEEERGACARTSSTLHTDTS